MIRCEPCEQKQAEKCPRSQSNGLKFLQESSKKIIHLFNAHMPQLTQIARSTVLRMQICFAWKSIWSCSKESRTALLLSPLAASRGAPSCRLSPLAWKTFSPAPHAWTYSQWQPPYLRLLKPPWANMQISQAHTGGPVRKRDEERAVCSVG